jgi:hypothetical protein
VTVLDLQAMPVEAPEATNGAYGGSTESTLSLLQCTPNPDSSLSLILC